MDLVGENIHFVEQIKRYFVFYPRYRPPNFSAMGTEGKRPNDSGKEEMFLGSNFSSYDQSNKKSSTEKNTVAHKEIYGS